MKPLANSPLQQPRTFTAHTHPQYKRQRRRPPPGKKTQATSTTSAIMMQTILRSACLLSSLLTLAHACVTPPPTPEPFSTFTNNAVFFPADNYSSWRTIYGRTLQLPDGSFLMTWEGYPPEPPQVAFPIYRSTDGGATWSEYSRVEDTVNGWGLRYQPFLYTLETAWGEYDAGTILISGASVPANLSEAFLDIYASRDAGLTWEFVSHIAHGAGPETVTNGNDAIWEPFFIPYGDQLICFYSDQRDPAHGQKLVAVTTSDLKSWSEPFDVVAYPTYEDRPGMAIVAHIESTGRYIMTYEYCGPQNCHVYYKVAESPLVFGDVEGIPLVSNDTAAVAPVGSPYVIWTPHPDRDDGSGLIIMNGASREEVFVNEDSALEDGWKMVDVGQWASYSRELRIVEVAGERRLLLANGGNMVSDSECNWVIVGVIPIPT